MDPATCPSAPSDGQHGRREGLAGLVAMYQLMVENLTDVIVRGNLDLERTYVSPAMREVFGYEPEELLGKSGYDLVHPDDRGRVHASVATLGPANPVLSQTFRMRRKDGQYLWVETRYRHIPEDNGVLAVVRDISARKNAEDRLAEANEKLADANLALAALANRDGLTGIANRRCFDARLLEEFRRAARQQLPVALVLLDLDCFKSFNDRHGHLAGDDCLRRVARVIEDGLRRPGDLVARYGGEELAILLPATDEIGALHIAEATRHRIADLGIAHLGSPHRIVTISAGVAAMVPFAPPDAPADLIMAADRALYGAKAAGRNQVCIASDPRDEQGNQGLTSPLPRGMAGGGGAGRVRNCVWQWAIQATLSLSVRACRKCGSTMGRATGVYYVRRGQVVFVLLCGGDKSTQVRDIGQAKTLAALWKIEP